MYLHVLTYMYSTSCSLVHKCMCVDFHPFLDRLRDTLIHELCHAACWIIDGNKSASHGPVWQAWADKALAHLPRLDPVTRCHNYEISYKHIYKCLRCDFKYVPISLVCGCLLYG